MSERICINIIETKGIVEILFNKTKQKIMYEIYGDMGFFYNGSVDSLSYDTKIRFNIPIDNIIFVKFIEYDNCQKKDTHIRFFIKHHNKQIKKNVSMKITKKDNFSDELNITDDISLLDSN